MNFRLTKGNFLKTGAYIEGDSAIFTFAAEKEDECSIVLLDKSGNTACVIDIPAEYSTGSLYSVRLHDEAQDPDRLMKICRASSSMPLLCPIVNIDGIPYLDGGLADSIPIRRAMDIGNEKIIVVLTRNRGYRKKAVSKAVEKMYRRAYRSYPNLLRTLLRRAPYYNRTLNELENLEREGKIFVIRPQVKPVSRLERSQEHLMAFYHHGYDLMEREYDRLMEYLEK